MDDQDKRTEQLLRDLLVYRDLVEKMRDVPYAVTADGVVTYIGPQVARYGLDPAEIISKSFFEFVAPEDRERLAADFRRSVSTGEEFPTEFCYRTRQGETCWFEGVSSLQYDEGGEVTGVLGILRDVSERRGTLDALKASEEKFRIISDSALDAVVMVDDAGNVTHWNPAAERIFGYRPEEILGRDVHEVLAPRRYLAAAKEGFDQFARTGTGYAVGRIRELEALKKDGSEFPIEIAVSPIWLGGRWCASAVARNVTERRRAAEARQREDERLRRLLEMYERDHRLAAFEIHDGLTQPLIAALMHVEAVLRVWRNDPAADINGPCDEAAGLLRQSIEEARRMMAGLRPAILDEMGLLAAIEYVIYEHRGKDHPEIEYQESVSFQRLAAPLETAVFRIVQEGLANACEHSETKKVRITLAEQDRHIRVEIQDWGVGFDPASVEENRYGLEGLRMRAQLFGGQAKTHTAPGKGTHLVVELPLVQPDDSVAPPSTGGDEPAE